MQLHREWLLTDLRQLNTDRFAVTQLRSEIETLELEFGAIKATSYDKIPSGGSGNSQQDKLELNLAKREELTASLKATESHVKDMERLLSQLTPDDRKLIEKLEIGRGSYTAEAVAKEIGIEVRQVHNRKKAAIDRLSRLRFGQGYRP